MKTDDNVWRITADKSGLLQPLIFEVPIDSNLGEFVQILVDSGFISFGIL